MTLPDTNRVTAEGRPDGVALDVSGYTRTTLTDLIGLLAERGDLVDGLLALFEKPEQTDPHSTTVVDRDDQFIDQLMAELPTTIRLHTGPARRLGALLGRLTRRPARRRLAVVPQQRDRRWTA